MEEIIAGWTAELEKRSAAFVKHAAELATWDRHILTNRRALLDLEDELKKVPFVIASVTLSHFKF